MRRHGDFERIHSEFLNYYKVAGLADTEYYQWIKDMTLDETLEYGQARESFKWAKDMIAFLKEDADNKYYQILLGFPLESMNGNVYSERDLIAGALSMKGKSPDLNHKERFWFSPKNPRNRWGHLPVVGAKYEDGAVECILKVPKSAICPICNGAKMTELIDNKRIVNVSLSGECKGGRDPVTGVCKGFEFGDPPFTLLTTDILPGIPLARIRPMESYLPFISRSSIKRGTRNKNVKKIIKLVPKHTKEAKEPGQMGMTPGPDMDTNVYRTSDLGTGTGPTGSNRFRGDLTPVSQQTKVAVGTDPAAAKPEGVWTTTQTTPASSTQVPQKEATVGTVLTVKPSEQPVVIKADPPMPEVDSHKGPDKTPVSTPDLTVSVVPPIGDTGETNPAMQPTAPGTMTPPPAHDCGVGKHWTDDRGCVPDVNEPTHDVLPKEADESCPEGQHKDTEGNCIDDVVEQEECPDGQHKDFEGNCVDDEATEERVKRWKAEDRAKTMEGRSLAWESRFVDINKQKNVLEGRLQELKTRLSQAEARKENAIRDFHNANVKAEQYSRLRNDAAGDRDNYKLAWEKLQRDYTVLGNKYNSSMATNLNLSKKVTEANEDFLTKAKELELVKEKLQTARNKGKQIVRLKV